MASDRDLVPLVESEEEYGISFEERQELNRRIDEATYVGLKVKDATSNSATLDIIPPLEKDPMGFKQHQVGSKLDFGKNRLGLVLAGFTRALQEVGKVGTFGANKYTDNGWMSVPNGVSRYTDALYRHLLKEAEGESLDNDSKLLHAAHAAWNALARLDLILREKENETDRT